MVRVAGVGKIYQIYDRPAYRLRQFLMPRLQRLVGFEPRRYYREFWALSDISFEIGRGETLGIIGRNGAGKSTLLQILSGTVAPTTGLVEVEGRVAALLELGAGFNPEFTGRENVYLTAGLYGLNRAQVNKRMTGIEAFADIGDFIDQPVKTYSSGMFVRLGFAVIAHVDADILIVDEALAVGDAYFTQKCMRFLRAFMETGTLIFVSHDTSAVQSLCSRAIWLDRGRMRMDGPPKDVSERYFESLFDASAEPLARPAVPPSEAVREGSEHAAKISNGPEVNGEQGFGQGGARIREVKLFHRDGRRVDTVQGGEPVVLEVRCKALHALLCPIIGFFVRDRLGQMLFGDNTFETYQNAPVSAEGGESLSARFAFDMPLLPSGDYSVCVAVADGTQAVHVQHHWIHDALIFRSRSSRVATGLVGIPMQFVKLEKTAV